METLPSTSSTYFFDNSKNSNLGAFYMMAQVGLRNVLLGFTHLIIQDYSIKTTDDFGNIVVQQRAYSKRADYDVTVETNRVSTVQKLLADIRTTPTVFIGEDDKPETVVYGFYKQLIGGDMV
jgi:hypothetical protein